MNAKLTDENAILVHGDLNRLIECCGGICAMIMKSALEAKIVATCCYSLEKAGLFYKVKFYIISGDKKIKISKDTLEAAVKYLNNNSLNNN
jgi:hypothetical protein